MISPHPNHRNCECDLFGQREFVKVNKVKDRKIRSSWTIQVGPKSSDNFSFKKHTVEKALTRVFLMEEEVGGIQSQVKEHLESPKARRGTEELPCRTFGRSIFLLTPCLRLLASRLV